MYCAPAELKHDLNEYKELHYGTAISKTGKCRCLHACDHKVILDLARIYTSVVGFAILFLCIWVPLSALMKGSSAPRGVNSTAAFKQGYNTNFRDTSGGVQRERVASQQLVSGSNRSNMTFSGSTVTPLPIRRAQMPPVQMFYSGVSGPVNADTVRQSAGGGAYAYGEDDLVDLTCAPAQFGKPRSQ